MKKNDQTPNGYVKTQTLYWVGASLFVLGFISGITLAILKTGGSSVPIAPGPASMPPAAVTEPQDFSAQIATWKRNAEEHPDVASNWTHLGNLYFDSKQVKPAIEAYEKSLAIEPNNADTWSDLGVMYRRDGQPKKAVDAFDKAIQLNPNHEISRFNKGVVLLHDLNDRKGAIEAWEKLVAINPAAVTPSGQSVEELLQHVKDHTE